MVDTAHDVTQGQRATTYKGLFGQTPANAEQANSNCMWGLYDIRARCTERDFEEAFQRQSQRPLISTEFRFVGVGGAGGAGGSTIPPRYPNARNVEARKPFPFTG